jgi:cytochrome P450
MIIKSMNDPIVGFKTGHFLSYTYNRESFLNSVAASQSDMFQIKLMNKKLWCPLDIEHIRHILVKNNTNYSKKTMGYQRLQEILGFGMVTKDGEAWKQSRQIASPFFIKKALDQEKMREHIEQWSSRLLQQGQFKDVHNGISLFSLELFLSLLVSKQEVFLASELLPALNYLFKSLERWHRFPFAWFIKATSKYDNKFVKSKIEMIIKIESLIQRHLDDDSFISAYKRQGFDVKELVGELQNMLIAGHETTANALTFGIIELARDPQTQNKIASGDKELLKSFILECFRLYPPIANFGRRAIADDQIGDHQIKAGDSITLSPFVVQRRSEYFNNPLEFHAGRFLDTDARKDVLFPFGMGERTCLGRQLAQMEMEMIIEGLVKKCQLRLNGDVAGKLPVEFCVSLRPAKKYSILVSSRS